MLKDLRQFLQTGFLIYCIYAFYCSLVIFNRPNNPGEIFRNLRIPIVVFIYFLVPCAALYLSFLAFWDIHEGLFWTGVALVLPLSFFIMLYFLTDPAWPVGKILELQKVPTSFMLILLSLNLAFSVVVAGAGAIAVIARPAVIEAGARAQEFHTASAGLQMAQGEEEAHQNQIQEIKREATTSVFKKYGDVLQVLLPLLTAVLTFATSMLTLKLQSK